MANAADRKSIRAQEKLSEREERERGEVLVKIAESANGRAWLWAKLESAHVFQTSYQPDALAMAFAEGERNQGLILLNDIIAWCPEQFIQMMVENNVRRSSRSNLDDNRTPESDSVGDGASRERSSDPESGRNDQGPGNKDDDGGFNIVDYGSVKVN